MQGKIEILIMKYREAALGANNISDPKQANKCQKILHSCYKMLRETEAGRELIMSLMCDKNPGVRCWAAAHSLQWDVATARSVLEALCSDKGVYSFTAEITLKEYEKGNLSFEY